MTKRRGSIAWVGAAAALLLLLSARSADAAKKKKSSSSSCSSKAQQQGHQEAGGSPKTFGRVQVPVTDAAVRLAADFAVEELKNICEYCDAATRASYEAMSLKEVHKAETKPLTVMNGTMYILNATLQTGVPVMKRSEDNQIIVVFQKPDGSYTALSTERSPFLSH